tara:strand:+ start:18068 stop:18655 length:588 start_codon:yes stop_codon:yes gene_type:complete
MEFNSKEIFTATAVLFAVIDILGSIPIIIGLKKKHKDIKPLRTTMVSLTLLILFLFLGESILHFIGIDIYSFAVAGSFILFFLGLELVLNLQIFKDDANEKAGSAVSIVPLAFPMIAGAGTMTSLISLRAEYEVINIIIAIIFNMLLVYVVLRNTHRIEKLLGDVGQAVLKKVFGIILLAIAVKLFSNNIQHLLN